MGGKGGGGGTGSGSPVIQITPSEKPELNIDIEFGVGLQLPKDPFRKPSPNSNNISPFFLFSKNFYSLSHFLKFIYF